MTFHLVHVYSKHALPWETREGQDGRRLASEYGATRTIGWQTRRKGTNQFTGKCKSANTKEDYCQSWYNFHPCLTIMTNIKLTFVISV